MAKVATYKKLKLSSKGIRVDHSALTHTSLYSHYYPSHYCDRLVKCKGCSAEFVFKAEQMKYMYEGLKLDVAVQRVLCSKCLQYLRSIKKEVVKLEGKIRPKGMKQTILKDEVEALFNALKELYRLKGRIDYAKLRRLQLLYNEMA